MTLCIWGKTREDVLQGYDDVASWEDPPQRITWRLASAFTGSPIGDECYAPGLPEIEAAYSDECYVPGTIPDEDFLIIPQVDEPEGDDDD